MPNRYRLKGASLEEIRRKAEQLYGPAARIVSAERVSSPGIAGLFAQDRYEAMVEIQSQHEVVTHALKLYVCHDAMRLPVGSEGRKVSHWVRSFVHVRPATMITLVAPVARTVRTTGAIPFTGWLSFRSPVEPRNWASPKVKMPPSVAASQ